VNDGGQLLDVAVITACHNHGRFVTDMLESVWAQTHPASEVVLVNDGSTDDTLDILEGLQHPRLRIIHTPNRGPSAARNTAIAHTTAPLILNLDADDKVAPTYLERAVHRFAQDPGLGIVYGEVRFFGARTGPFELPEYTLPTMLRDNVIVSAAVFRRCDWEVVGGYSEAFPHGTEDYDLWLSILELGRGVSRIPDDMLFYRTYPRETESRSGRRKRVRQKSIAARRTLFARHEALYRQCPDEYARIQSLIAKWDREPAAVRLLKDVAYKVRRVRVGGR
jgi:glycosyltransferase involved in cell wall biosynthesis